LAPTEVTMVQVTYPRIGVTGTERRCHGESSSVLALTLLATGGWLTIVYSHRRRIAVGYPVVRLIRERIDPT